ncbi:MAG: geranylgeranylglycerol-phosphate geranylgeranyltransferase [Candidatus Stahlbacteria bacterium]|nr:geranylgeranylglycerol-phosphate geranylgeranyltransferase [Candidatus Stahlbacteria bacterium]
MKIVYFVKLLRPLNGIIAGLSVLVGGLLTYEDISGNVFLACLVCFLIISAGNAMNDLVDSEIDKINRPTKPIPSGKLTKKEVIIGSTVLFIIGIMASILLGMQMLIITCLVSLLIIIYNFNLKRKGISGNLLVAFLSGFPFVYGGITMGKPIFTIIPFLFAFLLHFSREILKDIEDMVGDKTANSISLPIKYGNKKAIRLAIGILGLLILVTLLPPAMHLYNRFYLISVVICIDIPMCVIMYRLLKSETFVPAANNWLKLSMVIGLGVLVIGGYR